MNQLDLGTIVDAAFRFGPFLFAVLVLLYLTKRAHQDYVEVATRKEPKPRAEELRSRRLILYLAWGSGFALVLISVSWWLFEHAPMRKGFVRFEIVNVGVSDTLQPRDEDIYHRTRFLPSPDSDQGKEDYYFLVPVEGEPDVHRVITLNYIPSDPKGEADLWAKIGDLDKKRFEIRIVDGESRLEPFTPEKRTPN